jgi:hypothetical protein
MTKAVPLETIAAESIYDAIPDTTPIYQGLGVLFFDITIPLNLQTVRREISVWPTPVTMDGSNNFLLLLT